MNIFVKLYFLASALTMVPTGVYSATQRFLPAGTLMQCTINEKISSKTVALGDPVLCTIGGRSPQWFSGAALSGQFQEFKDPGHFVGKGWMELQFDQIIMADAQIIQVNAKVINVPGYNVDTQGHILGNGHATRDTLEWFIPILWPINIALLPRRGPTPTLKPESRITVKVMDNTWINDNILAPPPARTDPYGFRQRSSAESLREGTQAVFMIGADQSQYKRRFWNSMKDRIAATAVAFSAQPETADSKAYQEEQERIAMLYPSYRAAHPKRN